MSPTPEASRSSREITSDSEMPDNYQLTSSSSDSDGLEYHPNEGPDQHGYMLLTQDPDTAIVLNTQVDDSDCEESDTVESVDVDAIVTQSLDHDTFSCNRHRIQEPILETTNSVWNKPEFKSNISLTDENKETIMKAMSGFRIPSANQPHWAGEIIEDTWKSTLLSQIHSHASNQSLNFTQSTDKRDIQATSILETQTLEYATQPEGS